MPGYAFLWGFFFWPVFAGLLIAYAGHLFWQGRKSKADEA